jgi:hypothetical protein
LKNSGNPKTILVEKQFYYNIEASPGNPAVLFVGQDLLFLLALMITAPFPVPPFPPVSIPIPPASPIPPTAYE